MITSFLEVIDPFKNLLKIVLITSSPSFIPTKMTAKDFIFFTIKYQEKREQKGRNSK